MTIKLFSDIICPFCYIAEETIIPYLKARYGVDFLYLGMELHPQTPPGGVHIDDPRYAPFKAYVEKFAAAFNLPDVRMPEKTYNTRKALLMAEYARDAGRLPEFWQALLHAYWKEQINLEDETVLAQVATLCGLDSAQAVAAPANMEYQLRLDKRRYNAQKLGLTTLPAFMWDKQAILGCQPAEVFDRALGKQTLN